MIGVKIQGPVEDEIRRMALFFNVPIDMLVRQVLNQGLMATNLIFRSEMQTDTLDEKKSRVQVEDVP